MERIPPAEKVTRFKQFYDGTLEDGPLVGFYYGTYYPLRRFAAGARLNAGPLTPADLIVEDFKSDYEELLSAYSQGEGDGLWSAEAFYGIPWIEAVCGARVIADPEAGSTRAGPPEGFPAPSTNSTGGDLWREKVVEFVKMLKDLSGGRFPLATTLQRGIGDTLAAILGSPEFLFGMTDSPERVHALVDKIVLRWIELANSQLEHIPTFHGGVGTHFYDQWLPGRGVVIQDDAMALLSPDLFREFILPGLHSLAGQFDSSLIHLHPAGFLPVDDIVELQATAVELHRDLGGKTVEELIPTYRRVQNRKPLVIWGDLTIDELRLLRNSVDLNRLAIKPVVQSYQEAEDIWLMMKSPA